MGAYTPAVRFIRNRRKYKMLHLDYILSIKKTYNFLRYTPNFLCNFIFLPPAQNENFSIVRVRVLSESENRRFTSTDFDADLQAFRHEKSPMKSDFFGQISFLSPQYGADEGTQTHMVSHRNLKPARLPVSPHPHI